MEIYLILLFMIAGAIAAVEIKDLLSSIIAMSVVGLGLSLAFLILKAPNLAIAQLVIELLCLILLIRATIRRDLPLVRDGRWLFNTVSVLLFSILFLSFAYFALKELPKFGEPIMRISQEYIARGRALTGSDNIVAAISLNFRSYDTLGEVAVFLVSIVGVLAIMRKEGKSHEE